MDGAVKRIAERLNCVDNDNLYTSKQINFLANLINEYAASISKSLEDCPNLFNGKGLFYNDQVSKKLKPN